MTLIYTYIENPQIYLLIAPRLKLSITNVIEMNFQLRFRYKINISDNQFSLIDK